MLRSTCQAFTENQSLHLRPRLDDLNQRAFPEFLEILDEAQRQILGWAAQTGRRWWDYLACGRWRVWPRW